MADGCCETRLKMWGTTAENAVKSLTTEFEYDLGMAAINPSLLSQDDVVLLVIHEGGKAAPAAIPSTRRKAVGNSVRKKSRSFVLANGAIWESLNRTRTSAKHTAISNLEAVAIDDLVLAAHGAVSLEFKSPTPGMTLFLVRLLSALDSKLRDHLAGMSKEAFDESVNRVLRAISPPASPPEQQMAQRVAMARAAILQEFGAFTREQLAAGTSAREPGGLVDKWRSRGTVFAVTQPLSGATVADVYPAFQFEDGRPLPVVGKVLAAFDKRLDGWELAQWFTSSNSMLPGSARPADLLKTAPDAVVAAAMHDALPPAA